jgi:hypothetical protein
LDLHVDVVKNEWLAGFQFVVARVSVDDGALRIDSADPSVWEPIILRPVVSPMGEFHPEKDPQAFVEHLADGIHGTYLFATEPHAAQACPFSDGPVAPIAWGETRSAQLA